MILIVVPQERGTRLFRAQRTLAARVIEWIENPVRPEELPAVSSATPSELPPAETGDEEAFGDE
mgnify:FL=1